MQRKLFDKLGDYSKLAYSAGCLSECLVKAVQLTNKKIQTMEKAKLFNLIIFN